VPWLEASRRVGRLDEGIERLERIVTSAPSIDVFRAVFDARLARDGVDATIEWAEGILRNWPSLLALETLLSAGAESRNPRERARDDLIRSLAREQAERLGRYVCSYCGFKARTYYWRCPGCSRWDSYAPRRGEGIGECATGRAAHRAGGFPRGPRPRRGRRDARPLLVRGRRADFARGARSGGARSR